MALNDYLALVTSEHKSRPNFMAMLSVFLQASVDQQTQFAAFPTLFDVDYAVGDQLDKIGQWVGVSRNLSMSIMGVSTLPDDAYRVLIKLFIASNSWDGTVPGMYSIWNAVLAPLVGGILVQDNQDMTMFIVMLNPPVSVLILAIITEGYFQLRPAGVGMLGFFEISVPSTPAFGFDAENSSVSGFDVGAWVVPI